MSDTQRAPPLRPATRFLSLSSNGAASVSAGVVADVSPPFSHVCSGQDQAPSPWPNGRLTGCPHAFLYYYFF